MEGKLVWYIVAIWSAVGLCMYHIGTVATLAQCRYVMVDAELQS